MYKSILTLILKFFEKGILSVCVGGVGVCGCAYVRIFAYIFLNLSIMSFLKLVTLTKNTPFFPFLLVVAP